ncbi:S8 family serine peptidase [Paenibacillus sp. D2_2]|uniref:S8 family peptidase n=1 Tax=Paenibacillus sp. D2_2 TaxID=3073092 RepID=UPI002815D98E|nr:S8 family serine peptidase [Paenibacillus sp. D2_2]WMT43321.1 S8 family serine peptidase [Paenibacillus sp. D2_2]
MKGLFKRKKLVVVAIVGSMTCMSILGMTRIQAASIGFSKNNIATGFTTWSEQYTGKGVKVAVIDTGIAMDHPLFKGNIKKTYDFVENDLNPQDEKGHGTHVAGIIMQQAPDADLLVYRALVGNPQEAGDTPLVVKAIKQAVIDGAQVINLSLNADIDAPNEPVAQAVAEAVKQGVVIVKSAGNIGEDWAITSPGYGEEPIVVGATQQARTDTTLLSGTTEIHLLPLYGAKEFPTSGAASFMYAGKIAPEKLKDSKYWDKNLVIELSDEDVDVDPWYTAAHKTGVKGILFALPNMEYQGSTMQIKADADLIEMIPGAVLSMEDARKLKDATSKEWTWGSMNTEERVGDISSRGPAAGTWLMKPDLVAPGINIYSSKPGDEKYSLSSGTSMAAPQVTGAVALLLEAHPDWTPVMVKSALMQHANQLVNEQGTPCLRTEQGAGSVNFEVALKTNTFIELASLSFDPISVDNKEASPVRTKSFELTNTSSKSITYQLEAHNETAPGELNMDLPEKITVQPNQTVKIPVKWMVDKQQEAGIWTGSIQIKGNNDTLRLPVLLINQVKSYPLVMGLNMDNSMFAPSGDIERRTAVIDYYATVPAQRIMITATRNDEEPKSLAGKTYVLLSQANHPEGLFHYKFTGKDIYGAQLPNGDYSIKVKSFAEQRQTIIEDTTLFIDTKAPEIKNINPSKAVKGQLLGEIDDQMIRHPITRISITKEFERQHKYDVPLIKMQWSMDGKHWNYVRVNEEERRFFADFSSFMKTSGKQKIDLRVQDAFGNHAIRTIEVQIKK